MVERSPRIDGMSLPMARGVAVDGSPEILLASPWPPLRSDIARHVSQIKLPALAEVARVHLIGDLSPGAGPAPSFHGLPVLDVDTGLRMHPDAVLLAHIGNEVVQNQAALRALAVRPGFVVLHDLVMHHAWFEACRRAGGSEDYVRSIQRHYGIDAALQAEAAQYDGQVVHELARTIPLFEPFLDNALGVIVHSQMAYDGVAARGRWPVLRLDLPHPEPSNAAGLLAHRQAQVDALVAGQPLRLLVFGHLGRNRGLREIIGALAAFKAQGRYAMTLDIVGAVHGFEDLDAVLQRQGLTDWVRLHGFVTDEALDAALHHAHLAINLRLPTMGEASGSQMRLYGAALPGIVVDTGWYAEQPADAVCHVPSRLSAAALVQAITGVLENPSRLVVLAAGGLAQLERRHRPAPYMAQMLQFMAGVAPVGERLRLARAYMHRAGEVAAELEIQKMAGVGAAIASITVGASAKYGDLAMNNEAKLTASSVSTVPEVTPASLTALMENDAMLQGGQAGGLNGILGGQRRGALRSLPDDAGLKALAQRMHPRGALPERLRRGPLKWPRVEQGLLKIWNFISRDWREPVGMAHGVLARHHARAAQMEYAICQLSGQVSALRATLEEAEAHGTGQSLSPAVRPQSLQERMAQDAFMQRVGGYFRGDPEELRRRLQAHLPVVAQAFREAVIDEAQGTAPRILDLGCGRGGWLALMRDAGHAAHGVDQMAECVEICQRQQLSAECGDALQVLKEVASGSLVVVSAFHLIEHIPLQAQISLVEDAFRALAPGGLLLLETPNAENLEVIGRNFWHDPTHTKPVPAELLRVLALAAGFDAERTHTSFLQHPDVPEAERLTYPERLRHLLFCGQDTALYAWKTR